MTIVHRLLRAWVATVAFVGAVAAFTVSGNGATVQTASGPEPMPSPSVTSLAPSPHSVPATVPPPTPPTKPTVTTVTLPPLPDATVPTVPPVTLPGVLSGEDPAESICSTQLDGSPAGPDIREVGMYSGVDGVMTRFASSPDPGAWSPDGSAVAFHVVGGGVCVSDARGSETRLLLDADVQLGRADGWGSWVRWTKAGDAIAVLEEGPGPNDAGLWLLEPGGADARRIELPRASRGLQLSPTRGEALVTAWTDGDAALPLYVVQLDDGIARRVTSTTSYVADFRWSPDGETIAYTEHGALITVRRDGSGRRVVLTPSSGQGAVGSFDWSPDGASLVAGLASARSSGQVVVMTRDGREPRAIADGYLGSLVWSDDGWIVGARSTAGGGAELTRTRPVGGDSRTMATAPPSTGRDHRFVVTDDWTMSTPRFGVWDSEERRE